MVFPDLLGDRAASVALTPPEIKRYARHLIMPEVAMAGQQAAQGRQGPLHRHRRPGLAAVVVPGRGGSRHARTGRLRRRRRLEPSAPDHPLHRRRRPAQDRKRRGKAEGDQSPSHDRAPRALGRQLERSRAVRPLRRDRRRHRQLPDPLPGQRRLRPPGQAERLWLDLSLRRAGDRLFPAARSVLPLPLSRAAAARPRAQLRRGGRAGHLARA